MIIGAIIILFILSVILLVIGNVIENYLMTLLSIFSMLLVIIITIFGAIHGFRYYPPTEGTHIGIITAVDLEGKYFRRYEIYLKSSGYTNQSDETKYLLYDYEKDLAENLKNAIGKEVKLNYGHDGGYINWKNCGTYHIKSFEIIEEE